MSEQIRWGIIGCGSFCRRRILTAFPHVTNAKLVAIQRRDRAEAETTAQTFGVPKAYTKREELLADPEIDAVFIGTPNASHLEDVKAACAAGKHVLCEKPLGLNATECREMMDAAGTARVKLFVGNCGRYMNSLQLCREMIAKGEVGKLSSMHATYHVKGKQGTWRMDSRVSGGGPLLDLGPHIIDLLRFISKDEVVAVNAVTQPLRDLSTGQSELTVKAILRFSKGTLATISLSYEEPFRNGFEVGGSACSLRGDYNLSLIQNENIRLVKITSDPNPPHFENIPILRSEIYQQEIEDVSWVLLDPTALPICATGVDGLMTARIIDAIYESGAKRGAEVLVDGNDGGKKPVPTSNVLVEKDQVTVL
jgi:predicted dehydrogenase